MDLIQRGCGPDSSGSGQSPVAGRLLWTR